MSPDRGTHSSPLLWFSWNHGRTPFEGSPRILGKGFARLGEAAVGGTDEVPPTPLMWWAVSENWRVQLPAAVQEPFDVYVNGVAQRRGADYELRGHVPQERQRRCRLPGRRAANRRGGPPHHAS